MNNNSEEMIKALKIELANLKNDLSSQDQPSIYSLGYYHGMHAALRLIEAVNKENTQK